MYHNGVTAPKTKPRSAAAIRQARYRARKKANEQVEEVIATGSLPPKPDHTLAEAIRARMLAIVGQMTDEDLLDKSFAPMLSVGLKAEGLIDKREVAKQKQGTAELAFALIQMVSGVTAVPLLEPENPLEGEYTDVTPE